MEIHIASCFVQIDKWADRHEFQAFMNIASACCDNIYEF
jgi:hypothetical protein